MHRRAKNGSVAKPPTDAGMNLEGTAAGWCRLCIRLTSGRWVRANGDGDPTTASFVNLLAERVRDIQYDEVLSAPCSNEAGEVIALVTYVFGARLGVMHWQIRCLGAWSRPFGG